MIQKARKRTILVVGILVTGLISAVSGYLRTNYSKDDSLFVSTAHADFLQYSVGWDTGGCGGCSGGGSGY